MNIVTNSNKKTVSDVLKNKITEHLIKNEPVLLLASGGSSAPIVAEVLQELKKDQVLIPEKMQLLLTVSLIDERFGVEGHLESNWTLLKSLGLEESFATKIPILKSSTNTENDLKEATDTFIAFLERAVKKQKNLELKIFGIFGIGTDGHTAGILPDSPATLEEKSKLAVAYKSEIYTRITISPLFFEYIDYAVCWVSGKSKQKVLQILQTEVPPQIQPAQYLKRCKHCEIYTDLEKI